MMTRGAKRLAGWDSDPVIDDSMKSKRMLVGSLFNANRAEPSQHQQTTTPPLDMKRAELSRQHVRALNLQFASWIQTQLQNHPDELWEDGIQDYLNHASNITEKFSDIVNWLKANAKKGESSSGLGFGAAQKNLVSESKDKYNKFLLDKPGSTPAVATSILGSSWSSGAQNNLLSESNRSITKPPPDKPEIASAATSASSGSSFSSGVFFNNKPAFSFGIQTSVPASPNSVPLNHHNASNEEDEDDVEQPSSPSVKKTEERGILVVHEVKCKLYVKSTDPDDRDAWKDKGTGWLSIRCKEGFSKATKESKPTIIVRNDVGKVLLNALLYPGIKTNMQKNSIVAIFHTSGDGNSNDSVVTRTFLIRTKTVEDRDKLAAVIKEYAPAA